MSNYFEIIYQDLQATKGKVDPEELECVYRSKECILRCLYTLEVLYENLNESYEEFKKRHENENLDEIIKLLDEKIKKYKRNKKFEDWKEELVTISLAKMIKRKKIKELKSPMPYGAEIGSLIDFLVKMSHTFGEYSDY